VVGFLRPFITVASLMRCFASKYPETPDTEK
jgi:hypothetical protein